METQILPADVNVFGLRVTTFPLGIGEAFDDLIKKLPKGDQRLFYGISECTKDGIIYIAAAAETYAGEAERYGLESFVIEKGEYLATTVLDWMPKTGSIKQVFEDMFKDDRADRSKPCIEVYKNDLEMVCMVKVDRRRELKKEFNEVMEELRQTVSSFDEEQINDIPFKESWTAGQVTEHVIRVISGFAQMLKGPLAVTERIPTELIETFERDLLNFEAKYQTPEVIRPRENLHLKEQLLQKIEDVTSTINYLIDTSDLNKICSLFEVPVYGKLTGLEAVYFTVYHTKRHIHQLKRILEYLQTISRSTALFK